MFGRQLARTTTPIPGLDLFDLPVHGDSRGWFKENWQREKMTAIGLPDFAPMQNNISFNDQVGTTRGIHAEPWDKFVSVATGRIFGAWVDLREGPTFGAVFTAELDPSLAVFVPRGVGNAYQTLEPDTAYTYLVNDAWSPDATYSFLNLADETVAIPWPIPLTDAELSDKDRNHPQLADVRPMSPRRILITGADGQVGRALREHLGDAPHIEYATRADLDLTAGDLSSARRWQDYGTVINAAAFTNVDGAETPDGRKAAWAINAEAPAALARLAARHRITLVHISSDYVFDGASAAPLTERDPFSPVSAYGQSKAAGDIAVSTAPQHYILRTSWVIGDGHNFVRTMAALAGKGVSPRVVDDQIGRLTFAADIARAVTHLLDRRPEVGVYNISSSGPARSWADIARDVYSFLDRPTADVTSVSTQEYFAEADGPIATRPHNSLLDLSKLEATGFTPSSGSAALASYLEQL